MYSGGSQLLDMVIDSPLFSDPFWLGWLFFVIGLFFGSFVTLASYRLPKGEDIFTKRSRCTVCDHSLGVMDLVPVLSWVFQRAKCRYCDAKISARYPVIELALGIMFLLSYRHAGLVPSLWPLLVLCVTLLIMVVIDWEKMAMPRSLHIVMGLIAIAYVVTTDAPLSQLVFGPAIGLLFRAALYYLFAWQKHRETFGVNNIVLLALASAFLPLHLFTPFLLTAIMVGIIGVIAWGFMGKDGGVPFGPILAVTLFFGLVMPNIFGALKHHAIDVLIKP